MVAKITHVPGDVLADFCRRNRICRLAVFGSILHGDARPDSDLDLLVEFEKGAVPGLAFFRIQEELSRMFNRRVDLNTPNCLPERIRNPVSQEAEVLYAAS